MALIIIQGIGDVLGRPGHRKLHTFGCCYTRSKRLAQRINREFLVRNQRRDLRNGACLVQSRLFSLCFEDVQNRRDTTHLLLVEIKPVTQVTQRSTHAETATMAPGFVGF